MKTRTFNSHPALLSAITLVLCSSSYAANFYWDGSSSINWSQVANWSTVGGATTPDPSVVPVITDDVFFNISTLNTNQIVSLNSANRAANSLTFSSTGTTTFNRQSTPNSGASTLTVGGGGITVNNGAGAVTFGDTLATGQKVNMAAATSLNIDNDSSSLLTFSRPWTSTATSGTTTLSVIGSGSGGTKFLGAIGNGTAGSNVALTISTTGGTTTLSGANTYTGRTTVTSGTVNFNSIGNVGASSSALGAPANAVDGTIDLSGTLTYSGASASSDRIINLTGISILNNSGSGSLDLSGGITGTNRDLTARGASQIIQSGIIATGTGRVIRTDAGTLTLTNAANSFSGTVNALSGTISADSISDAGTPSALGQGTTFNFGQASFAGIGKLQFTGASGGSSNRALTINSPSGTASGGIIENTVSGQTLVLSGTVTKGGVGETPQLQLIGSGDGEMSGAINGSGLAITKDGAGTWTLSNAVNTYTGLTTVTSGTLIIAGNISTSSLATVRTGGTLGGIGTVGALMVENGGTLAPGNSPGILSAGNTSLLAGSALEIEINGATVGSGYDQLNVTGTISLAGLLNITMGYPPLENSLFFILANEGIDEISGTFSNAPTNGETYSFGGQAFQISYFGDSVGNTFDGGNDVVLMAIPEPAAATLLGGLGALGLLRRRRD
jgi:fibronectin-binding autotransporter adhesin